MPFDPLSATIAGGGLILDFIKGQQARKDAQAAQQYQQQQLAQALLDARQGKSQAGSLRLDQFGNATYYDPTQGRWVTSFSPTQQRIIDEGQARQRRAQIRGAQASEDYDTLRGQYLYRRPKTEAESYQEIVNLINQAQGQGERGLNTLMERFGVRTHGNIPVVEQMDRGPTPGQQLAETMLKARGAALDEYLKREQGHQSRYLPALKQFEETANYVAPIDPTGSSIIGLESEGRKAMSDYDKLIANIQLGGARNVGAASSAISAANKAGPGAGDFLNFAKMLMPTPDKTAAGTTGGTRGARASTSGGGDTPTIGDWDHRYNFLMTNDPMKGAGGEAAGLGGASGRPPEDILSDPYAYVARNPLSVPDYGAYSPPGSAVDYSEGYYRTPWSF
jgi:hypothetical protein